MNSKIKTQWLEALRSGEYKQGRGKLRDLEDNYCCLGVLCDVIDSDKWQLTGREAFPYAYDGGSTVCLNPDIEERTLLYNSKATLLAVKNDNGESFQEIAKYIEENL